MPSIQEAREIQTELALRVVRKGTLKNIRLIGGMDVSQNMYDPAQMIYASAVVLSYPEMEVVERASVAQKQVFPYIPGLLGFREAPALIEAFGRLQCVPDALLIDGHGVSHPRGLGIASHVGVLLNLPAIGVAKSILVGQPESDLGQKAGSRVPLRYHGELLGTFLRSKKRANPLIISVGHLIALEEAVNIVQSCLKGYRLPEPTRQAHLAANAFRKMSKYT